MITLLWFTSYLFSSILKFIAKTCKNSFISHYMFKPASRNLAGLVVRAVSVSLSRPDQSSLVWSGPALIF